MSEFDIYANNQSTLSVLDFDGTPTFELPHRPFFSIVVPCYNSKLYIGQLLNSIRIQNLKDDIEVILVDDCSPEDYTDAIVPYINDICIRRYKTEHNFAPGHTRELGAEHANGQWLMFCDHDDLLCNDALINIKKEIEECGEPYYVISNFLELKAGTDEILRNFVHTPGWTHGKFYNIDNIWKPYNIHYRNDMFSHEDIYLCSTMNCIMSRLHRKPHYSETYTYIWYSRPESCSHKKYTAAVDNTGHQFLEVFFPDYLRSTADVYMDNYRRGIIDYMYALNNMIEIILYSYFYMMAFIIHRPNDFIKANLEYSRGLVVETKQVFRVTNEDILNIVNKDMGENYNSIERTAHIGVGPFVPYMTLEEWLDNMHKDGTAIPITEIRFTHDNSMNNTAIDESHSENEIASVNDAVANDDVIVDEVVDAGEE